MKLLILVAALLPFGFTAPPLDQSTSVNSNGFVKSQPEDTAPLIVDANNILKYKREIRVPLQPTILPLQVLDETKLIKSEPDDASVPAAKPDSTTHEEHNLGVRLHTKTEHKRDIPVPLVPKHKHPEVTPNSDEKEFKEGNDDSKKHVKAKPEHKGSLPEVQVEDLSEHSSLHSPLDNQSSHLLEKTTNKIPTEQHPVIRPKPVPVAELFARHHDN